MEVEVFHSWWWMLFLSSIHPHPVHVGITRFLNLAVHINSGVGRLKCQNGASKMNRIKPRIRSFGMKFQNYTLFWKPNICHPPPQKKKGGLVCLDVSPFPFWGGIFQVNQPLGFGGANVLLFKTTIFGWWLELDILDLVWALATQGMQWNHHSKWCDIKQKKQLIQREAIPESIWHNGIMSYKPCFWWISMFLGVSGFWCFFDSHSTRDVISLPCIYLIIFPGTKPRVKVCKGIRKVYCTPRKALF